jgi:hypothetical protein
MINRITTDFGLVVSAMEGVEIPQYMYGHIVEINNRLMSRNVNPILRDQKYPLIALRLDTPAKVSGGFLRYKLNVAILAKTDKLYNAEQREQNIFVPILNPLYNSLMEALRQSSFTWDGFQDYPPHTRVDRYFWGTPKENMNVKNIFTDPLDAIELIDLEINSEIKNC